MQPARRPATYDDLLAMPEDARAEIIAGSITVMPAPLPRHARVQGALSREIGGPFDGDDGRGGPLEVSRLFPPRPRKEPEEPA